MGYVIGLAAVVIAGLALVVVGVRAAVSARRFAAVAATRRSHTGERVEALVARRVALAEEIDLRRARRRRGGQDHLAA